MVWDTLQDHRYLWTGPYGASDCPSLLCFNINFLFMYTTFCNFLCITVWHIYTKKTNQTAVSIHSGFLTCIRFWKCFSLRHFGQLCILSIPDAIRYFLVNSIPVETPFFFVHWSRDLTYTAGIITSGLDSNAWRECKYNVIHGKNGKAH